MLLSNFTVPPKIQQPPSITNIITTNQATLPEIPLPNSPLSEFPALRPWIAHAGQIILIHVSLSVRIDCEIRKGSPRPDISWWSGHERLQNNSKLEIYGNGSLLIKNADEDVDGVYTCVAETRGLPPDQINTTVSTIGESNQRFVYFYLFLSSFSGDRESPSPLPLSW